MVQKFLTIFNIFINNQIIRKVVRFKDKCWQIIYSSFLSKKDYIFWLVLSFFSDTCQNYTIFISDTVDTTKTKDQRWSVINIRDTIDITIAAVSNVRKECAKWILWYTSGIFPFKIRYLWLSEAWEERIDSIFPRKISSRLRKVMTKKIWRKTAN